MNTVLETIKEDIQNNDVVLYMKGEKKSPMCGFSHMAVSILNKYKIEYKTRNVLSDESLRQTIKEFSKWPTIPQLYVKGEFVGGSDIMQEMDKSGELKELLEK